MVKPRTSPTRGNRTILIGAALLGAVARFNGPATLTAIAAAAHMSPSRAYRYLRGLVDSGLLQQDGPSGRYDLGPEVLNLGLAAIGRLDPVKLAVPVLGELSRDAELVSIVSVWGSHGPTVIHCEYGNLVAPIRIREGLALPLMRTAAGHLFLTYLPEEATAELLARETAEWNAAHARKDAYAPDRIAALRNEVRRRGLARAVGARDPNHANLAAPVFDRAGKMQLAITLMGVTGSFDVSFDGKPARQLRAAAAAVSRQLGYRPDETAPAKKSRRRAAAE